MLGKGSTHRVLVLVPIFAFSKMRKYYTFNLRYPFLPGVL